MSTTGSPERGYLSTNFPHRRSFPVLGFSLCRGLKSTLNGLLWGYCVGIDLGFSLLGLYVGDEVVGLFLFYWW